MSTENHEAIHQLVESLSVSWNNALISAVAFDPEALARQLNEVAVHLKKLELIPIDHELVYPIRFVLMRMQGGIINLRRPELFSFAPIIQDALKKLLRRIS